MKNTLVVCASALLLLSLASEANAQNVLGRLADRAKNAAENAVGKKIENAVYKAVDKAFAGEENNSNQQKQTGNAHTKSGDPAYNAGAYSSSSSTEIAVGSEQDYILNFVTELGPTVSFAERQYVVAYDEMEGEINPVKCHALADLIKLIPELPSEVQLIERDPVFSKACSVFQATADSYFNEISSMTNAIIVNQANSARSSASPAQRARMNSGAMDIFLLMKKHGIDPEKASDEEMEAFMMKMIASGELQMPGAGQAVAIDMNYSEEMESNIDIISAKIDAIIAKVDDYLNRQVNYLTMTTNNALQPVYEEIKASWVGSKSFNNVYDIEKDIDARVNEYIRNLPNTYDNFAEIKFPSFWENGRKQENKIISAHNLANAAKWIAAIKQFKGDINSIFSEFATVDAELDATFTNKDDLTYATLKSNLNSYFFQLKSVYSMILSEVYRMPLVDSVAESKSLTM